MYRRNLRAATAIVSAFFVAGASLVAPGAAASVTGRAASWGYNYSGQLGNNSNTTSNVPVAVDTNGVLLGRRISAVSAGNAHSCAVADGKAYCWGFNTYGQLGNNSNTDTGVPVAVDTTGVLADKTITGISAAWSHTCAVADGKAYCWGDNASGQLGNNSNTGSRVPVAVFTAGVLAGKTITQISVATDHTCAVADGSAFCWGDNAFGQLGNTSNADSKTPVQVSTTGVLSGKTVAAVSTGGSHSCALAAGRASCWGNGGNGQLGNSSTTSSNVPVAVNTTGPLAARTVTTVSAGFTHTCAVAEGRVSCWGANNAGQLGNKSNVSSTVPVPVDTDGVLAGATVSEVSSGGHFTCAIADQRLSCWGSGDLGQLGNHSNTNSNVPVSVETNGTLAAQQLPFMDAGGSHTLVIFASVPQPPTGVTADPGDGQVTVSWTPAVDDGGSAVVEFVATANPGGASCTTATTGCAVHGLTNGTAYTFTVTARNGIGASDPSAPSQAVTPIAAAAPQTPITPTTTAAPQTPITTVQPPGKVTGVKAKARKGTVKITWKAATGADSYRARMSKPGGKKYQAWTSTPKTTFKAKVKQGKVYRFQITAVGPGGNGATTTIRFEGR